jgi:hypothetical protein
MGAMPTSPHLAVSSPAESYPPAWMELNEGLNDLSLALNPRLAPPPKFQARIFPVWIMR